MTMLSLVVPCYNEQDNVRPFAESARRELAPLAGWLDYEIIFVNDGSRDGTLPALQALVAEGADNITVLDFSRNFGKEAAIYAGLRTAAGDYIAFVDADLQQPVSVAREMLEFLEQNPEYDAACAYQETRLEGAGLSFLKRGFYRVINTMCEVPLHADASDFRVIRRPVAEAILAMPEYHRFSKGIFSWIGFNTYYRPYQAQARHAGQSSWSTRQLFRYAFDGIISFSTKPLKLATGLGGLLSAASLIYMVVVILQKLLWGNDVPGYPTLVVLILLMGGIQLVVLGIMGEYLARVHIETKHRPIYLQKGRYSCRRGQAPAAGSEPDNQNMAVTR